MSGSKWRGQVDAIRRLLPTPKIEIEGVLMRIIDPRCPNMIAGLTYDCCGGFTHELAGQLINFDPPIQADDLPEPWCSLWRESRQDT